MIRDHEYEVIGDVKHGKDGESMNFLTCTKCGSMFEIRGDTQKQRNTHILILLQSFKWQPCVGPIEAAVRRGIRQGNKYSRSSQPHYGASNISAAVNKTMDIHSTLDAVKDAMKSARLNTNTKQ